MLCSLGNDLNTGSEIQEDSPARVWLLLIRWLGICLCLFFLVCRQKWKNKFFFQLLQRIQLLERIFSDFRLRNTGFRCLAWGHQAIVPPAMVACGWPHFPRGWFYSHLSCAPGRRRGFKQMRAVGSEREKCSKRTTQGTARTTLIWLPKMEPTRYTRQASEGKRCRGEVYGGSQRVKNLSPGTEQERHLEGLWVVPFYPHSVFSTLPDSEECKKKKKKILDSFFNLDEASQRRMLETDYIDHPGYFPGALLCLFESCQPISHYQVKGTDRPSPEHTNSRQAHLLCPSGV